MFLTDGDECKVLVHFLKIKKKVYVSFLFRANYRSDFLIWLYVPAHQWQPDLVEILFFLGVNRFTLSILKMLHIFMLGKTRVCYQLTMNIQYTENDNTKIGHDTSLFLTVNEKCNAAVNILLGVGSEMDVLLCCYMEMYLCLVS